MTIKATTKALLGTAVSFALLGTAGMANAADLDNLSDDDLLKRIERLEKIIGPGENNAVRNGNDKVRLTLSGQVNRLALGFGDGEDFEVRNADNTTSSTRFRLLGAAKLDENWSAGTNFEIEVTSENSVALSQDSVSVANAAGGDTLLDVRRAALFVKNKTLGQVLIGQFQTASDFSFHNDLSGTFISGYSEVHLIGGGINFRASGSIATDQAPDASAAAVVGGAVSAAAGGNAVIVPVAAAPGTVAFSDALTTLTVSDVTTAFGADGGGRDDVIRYDTAVFGGFQGRASYTNGDEWAVDLGYRSKDLVGFSVAGNIAYTNFGDDSDGSTGTEDDLDLVSGSISAVHNATGLNATFSYADSSADNEAIYGKLGWKAKLTPLGNSNFVFEAGRFTNQNGNDSEAILTSGADSTAIADTDPTQAGVQLAASNNDIAAIINTAFETEATVLGVAYVQNIDALALEAFVAYRNFSVDSIGGVDFDDVNTIAVGGRIKF